MTLVRPAAAPQPKLLANVNTKLIISCRPQQSFQKSALSCVLPPPSFLFQRRRFLPSLRRALSECCNVKRALFSRTLLTSWRDESLHEIPFHGLIPFSKAFLLFDLRHQVVCNTCNLTTYNLILFCQDSFTKPLLMPSSATAGNLHPLSFNQVRSLNLPNVASATAKTSLGYLGSCCFSSRRSRQGASGITDDQSVMLVPCAFLWPRFPYS